MNIVEQLAFHAHDLAQSVGGNHTVEIWSWVSLTPGKPLDIHCKCCLGETGSELVSAFGQTVESAFVECVDKWKKIGSPTVPNDLKVEKLKTEAQKLGYTLTPVTQPEPSNV